MGDGQRVVLVVLVSPLSLLHSLFVQSPRGRIESYSGTSDLTPVPDALLNARKLRVLGREP